MNRGLRLTPKIIAELAEGYRSGKDTTELAKIFNMSKATVSRGLAKIGIDAERRDNLFTPVVVPPDVIKAMIVDFKSGILNIRTLAKKYDLSPSVAIRVLTENGVIVKRRPYKKSVLPKETQVVKMGTNNTKKLLSEAEQLELCEKFVDGPQSKIELADEYQISPDTVSAILRRHNITIKKFLPEDVAAQLGEDYKAGLEVLDLAEIYNQEPEVIVYNLTKRGLLDKMKEVRTNLTVVDEPATTLSPAALRKMAKSMSPRMLLLLEAMANNPMVNHRTRATCAQIIIDRGYGKAREEEDEGGSTQSSTERILKLVTNQDKLFKKA